MRRAIIIIIVLILLAFGTAYLYYNSSSSFQTMFPRGGGDPEVASFTPSSKTVCDADSCTETMYTDRMFYFEDEWKPIDNIFAFNGTHYVAEGNNFKVYISGTNVIIKGEDESQISYSIPASSGPSVSGNRALYWITGGGTNISVVLTLTHTSLDKFLTVYSINRNKNWDNYLENLNDTLAKSRFTISPLKIWYNVNNSTDSWSVYYDANWTAGGGFSIDKAWLQTAVLPIYIDPTVTYNFTIVNGNKAYASTTDSNTATATATTANGDHPMTFAQTFGLGENLTANGYSWLTVIDGNEAVLTSSTANREPFLYSNFTIKPSVYINWINATTVFHTITGTDDGCWMMYANFTNGVWHPVGAILTTTSGNNTRSVNLTTAADIGKAVNAANVFSVLNWASDADANEGCHINFVQVVVNYNSSMTFSNPAVNATSNSAPNTPINFTMTATTNNDDISHYWFSNNFSGGWSNTTAYALTGTQITGTVNASNTSATAGIYGWKFCVNTSNNYINCSDVQNFNFTAKTLEVAWTPANAQSAINDTTCTSGSPCTYSQYDVFNASGNVTCKTNPSGQSCGSITGGVMYNDSASTFAYVDITADAEPFYISAPLISGTTCENMTNIGDTQTTPDFVNNNYGGATSIKIQSSGGNIDLRAWMKFRTNTTYQISSILNSTLFLYKYINEGFTTSRTYNVYNTSDIYLTANIPWWEGDQDGTTSCTGGACLVNANATTTKILQNQTTIESTLKWYSFNVTNGFISANSNSKNISLTVWDNVESDGGTNASTFYSKESTNENKPYLTVCYNYQYINPNPSSVGTLSDGSSYLLNYTVNATASSGMYNFTFNFSSDGNPNPPVNRTLDAFINMGAYVPPASTCAYSGSGDWAIDCKDNCDNSTDVVNIIGNINIYSTGAGKVVFGSVAAKRFNFNATHACAYYWTNRTVTG